MSSTVVRKLFTLKGIIKIFTNLNFENLHENVNFNILLIGKGHSKERCWINGPPVVCVNAWIGFFCYVNAWKSKFFAWMRENLSLAWCVDCLILLRECVKLHLFPDFPDLIKGFSDFRKNRIAWISKKIAWMREFSSDWGASIINFVKIIFLNSITSSKD